MANNEPLPTTSLALCAITSPEMCHQPPPTEELLLAMAPIHEVIQSFNRSVSDGNCPGDFKEQDRFADLIISCREKFPPSERYLKALIRHYINQVEEDGGLVASDNLVEIVFQASLSKDMFPNPDESSYLSFFIPTGSPASDASGCKLLRIRQFPYHNDVALRLWEAGACLAEYFLENKSRASQKRIMELGAGVGLTGLVLAGCCDAARVHLTDYTDASLLNLEHNIVVNKEWLSASGESPIITQGYLEWSDFMQGAERAKVSPTNMLTEADVLIAADVIYDVAVIEDLVAVIKYFLLADPMEKEVILAITRRNLATFELFLQSLRSFDISSEWIADGQDCNSLPKVFKCNFNQSRLDVRIASLKLKH